MTELTKKDVLAVAYSRAARIYNQELPKATDSEEYLKQLQEQYLELRKQEYEYVVMQQAYDMYLASRCVNDKDCRTLVFASSEDVALNILESACIDEFEPSSINDLENGDNSYRVHTRRDDENKIEADTTVFNNATRQIYEIHWVDGKLRKESDSAHCAMTAFRIVTGISNRLGYTEENNFGYNAQNAASAGLIHGIDKNGKNEDGAIQRGTYSNVDLKKPLNELIKDGEIGPGDIISTKGRGASGFHALTVASVDRNEKGEIIGYTLMDNNGGKAPKTRLISHKIDDPYGNQPVLYTKTHEWAYKQFENEIKGKSAEELEKMIAETKDRMCSNVIVDLAMNECTLLLDKEYLKTCGTTKDGLPRAPGLKAQQNAFMAFYLQQNAKLINEGKALQERAKAIVTSSKPTFNEELEVVIDPNGLAQTAITPTKEEKLITKKIMKMQAVIDKRSNNSKVDDESPSAFDERLARRRKNYRQAQTHSGHEI